MLKSYLLTGYRNILRTTTSSMINIIGLSISIGLVIQVYLYRQTFYNLDSMHEKVDRIYLVANTIREGEKDTKSATSPYLLADLLNSNASVEKTARALRGTASVRNGDNVFNERLLFAEPSFIELFDFKINSGDRASLTKKNSLMLTEDMAKKYFGNLNVVGQRLSLKFNDSLKTEFTVGAVLKNIPANSSMRFNFLIPLEVWKEINKTQSEDWAHNSTVTFALLRPGSSTDQLSQTFGDYRKLQNQANPDRAVQEVICIPQKGVPLASNNMEGSLSWSENPNSFRSQAILATFLLLLACFNYMNVAIATVSTRLKEIGVRKVVGGGKKEIIFQFLTENLILCSIALVAGIGLAYYFFVPSFEKLFPVKIAFEFSMWQNSIAFLLFLLIMVSLISGGYPSLYIASFNAVKILRGKEKFGSRSKFSRTLLMVQFLLSVVIIVSCLTFVWSNFFLQNKSWGYDHKTVVEVKLQKPIQFEEMRKDILANKNIISYSGAVHHIGRSNEPVVIDFHQNKYSAIHFAVGYNYPETMNLKLQAGRFFKEEIESDKREAAIISHTFAQKLNLSNPLEESFEYQGTKYYVIGVVEDFYYSDFYHALESAFFTVAPQEQFSYAAIKIADQNMDETISSIKGTWSKVAPDDPFEGGKQENVFEFFMRNLTANNAVNFFVSFFAVVLSAMGLYGLVSFNITRRLKEFSVRKVFGASTFQIFRLINKEYFWMIAIALGLGVPLGTMFIVSNIKAIYPVSVPTTPWPNIVCILVVAVTVAITVILQLRRVVVENPAKTLKND